MQDPVPSFSAEQHEHPVYHDQYLINQNTDCIFPRIKNILQTHSSVTGQLIDVGCGNTSLLQKLRQEFKNRFMYSGIDLYLNKDSQNDQPLNLVQRNLNHDFYDVGEQQFDVVTSCEVIEHVVDTDHFITNIKKMLKPHGMLIVTTPNLSSIFNRLLLLFGFQPLHTEVSWQNPYLGREVLYDYLRVPRTYAAGHLRLFTAYALKKFFEFHGFEVLAQSGFSTYTGMLGKVSRCFKFCPALMPSLFFVLRKKS